MKLTRNLYVPFLDTSKGVGDTRTYVPVDLSTIFELAANPQEETYGYICYANDVTETTSYQPELPQEIVLDSDNPMYKFIKDLFFDFPTGSSAIVPCLISIPDDTTAQSTDGYLWEKAVISLGSLNTVDGKISFTIKLNGDRVHGVVSNSGGTVSFTPEAEVPEG